MHDDFGAGAGNFVETSDSMAIETALGRLSVDFSARGLWRVAFEHAPAPACESFKRSALARGWAEEIRHRAAGGVPRRALPIDESLRSQATTSLGDDSFRVRTWRLIEAIAHGESSSYGELARRLGQPRAARAVARACADNPLLLVVPCHRVIRSDGSVGGYRGGAERKRALLASERCAAGH